MTPAARCRLAIAMTALAGYAACGDEPAETVVAAGPPPIAYENEGRIDHTRPHVPNVTDGLDRTIATAPKTSRSKPRPRPVQPARTTPPAGGALPPRSVLLCESGGDYQAENPRSSASGGWQIIDSTWGNYKGYPRAKDAPPHIQDERAAQLWAGGRGASHWRSCL